MKNQIYIWVMIFIVLLLIATNIRQCKTNVSNNRSWNAVSDTMSNKLDRQGKTISYIQAVNDNRKGAINKLRYSNDSLSIRLADVIKNAGPRVVTATIIETITKLDTLTDVIVRWDTIKKSDTLYLYPVYDSYLKNRWIQLEISATKDSIKTDLTLYNAFEVVHKANRKGVYITVKNNSPYSSTSDIKSFTVKRKRRRFGLGLHVGYGVGLDGVISPNIGISAQYQFIQF